MDQEPVSSTMYLQALIFNMNVSLFSNIMYFFLFRRYEYRKYNTKGLGQSRLGRDRIDKLNSIGFQWRLRPEKIPWDDRFKVRHAFALYITSLFLQHMMY